jgi:hypothetical protein
VCTKERRRRAGTNRNVSRPGATRRPPTKRVGLLSAEKPKIDEAN